MDYETLVSQHETIESVIQSLLALLRLPTPQPDDASRILALLATLIRDHLEVEDPVIYETLTVTRDTRHSEVAAVSARCMEELKKDWVQYLLSWDRAAVREDWTGFVEVSVPMLERVRERVTRETAILYSLAYHYNLISSRG